MIDIEGAQLAGTQAGIVQLVTVLEIDRNGVTQASVAEFFDLIGLEPGPRSCVNVEIAILS